jgi:Putative endonuclease, protein of unknown function (DUF1780)
MGYTSLNKKNILTELLNSAKRNIGFFSNAGRTEREQWVVSNFLDLIGLKFEKNELNSPEEASKIDVEFRDARFQIKEITDPNCKRTEIERDTYRSILAAERPEDIKYPSIACDVPPVSKIYDLVLKTASHPSIHKKYLNHKSNLDLLFYVTTTRSSPIKIHEINISDFSTLGWRSISCLYTNQAIVLYASGNSPGFIKEYVNSINH